VLGISCDSVASHKFFAQECGGIEFPMLSDFWPHGEVAKRYGVLMEDAGHPARSVFVVDSGGTVRWAFHAGLDEQRDVNQIIQALENIEKK
jgi:mycoredoxin-dependent peroxiredoxin